MEEIIRVENLCKVYKIYKRPLDRLKSLLMKDASSEPYTALDNISFTVRKGESLGIIGENGAGKSTLLKIISGVLSPSGGIFDSRGRVLSIIELGVGFHPEFTGRENIFFYGDILGFSRKLLKDKVDEIVDFSELGTFIDKPIKTYSSGMLLRLSFSTVTSFDPEILVLDEVLAVGDIHFQRKSLNRILNYKKKGMTILFCSHDAYQIRMMCDRALWLKDGRVADLGEPESVIFKYVSYQMKKDESPADIPASAPVVISNVRLMNEGAIKTFDDITFQITTKANGNTPYHLMLSIKISTEVGVCITGTHLSHMQPLRGDRKVNITFPNAGLIGGSFYAHARVYDGNGMVLYHENVTSFFDVVRNADEIGLCYMKCVWDIE